MSWGYISKSLIAKSCGKSIFSIKRHCKIIFQSGFAILHFRQQHMTDPASCIQTNICIISTFNFIHSNRHIMTTHYGF